MDEESWERDHGREIKEEDSSRRDGGEESWGEIVETNPERGIMGQTSWRRNQGGGIMADTSWRNDVGGIM